MRDACLNRRMNHKILRTIEHTNKLPLLQIELRGLDMKAVFAGQLDRVFANEFAIFVGPESDDHWDLDSVEEQRSADRGYFHLAGTFAALCDEVVSLPYVRYAADPICHENASVNSEITTDSQALWSRIDAAISFDHVATDALELAKVCALMGQLAAATDVVLDEVDTEEAWIGHYHALKHLHGDNGVPLAYLAGLLMQAFHACETGAVFVLAECDRLILADLGSMIVRKRWPRPFSIPDLRHMGPPYNARRCGPLLNLCPSDLTDVEAFRRDPAIRAYAEAISEIVRSAEAGNVGAALQTANRSRRSGITRCVEGIAEIQMIAANVRMFSNAGTVTPVRNSAWDDWSKRRLPSRRLKTIVLA